MIVPDVIVYAVIDDASRPTSGSATRSRSSCAARTPSGSSQRVARGASHPEELTAIAEDWRYYSDGCDLMPFCPAWASSFRSRRIAHLHSAESLVSECVRCDAGRSQSPAMRQRPQREAMYPGLGVETHADRR